MAEKIWINQKQIHTEDGREWSEWCAVKDSSAIEEKCMCDPIRFKYSAADSAIRITRTDEFWKKEKKKSDRFIEDRRRLRPRRGKGAEKERRSRHVDLFCVRRFSTVRIFLEKNECVTLCLPNDSIDNIILDTSDAGAKCGKKKILAQSKIYCVWLPSCYRALGEARRLTSLYENSNTIEDPKR